MFSDNSIFLFLTLFSISVVVHSLVQLPTNENDIAYTEAIIRDTFNNIFTTLRIRNLSNKPRLKEFTTIYNFFVSITLKDCNNLKEIERLSRVYDNNNGRNLITHINEILNENDGSDVLTDNSYVTMYIVETFIKKLRYFKEIYKIQNTISSSTINPEILRHLINDEEMLTNVTEDASKMNFPNETILNDIQIWGPSVRRVYKGHSVDIRSFPFMASIHEFNIYRCGGSVIKSDIIVTSSTCIINLRAFVSESLEHVSVRLGSSYTSFGGETIGVKAIHTYPHFNPATFEHNIALVILRRPVVIATLKHTIKTIDYDKTPTPLSRNTDEIIVLGWGAKKDNDHVEHHQLSYSVLDLYPFHKCQSLLEKIFSKRFLTSRHFCGALFPNGGACQRDIGGPGIIKDKLVGIINYATDICGKTPTVFTKVGYYAYWIRQVAIKEGAYIALKTDSSPSRNASKQHYLGSHVADTVKQETTPATELDFAKVLKGFEDLVSTIFSRAKDNTSIEVTNNGTDKTNTTFDILD